MTLAVRPAMLIVLDGFGIGKDSPFNAIQNARMPFYRNLIQKYPHSQLFTHGRAVGLPDGVMGNSEVGHMTMGAGRVIYQDLVRITNSISDGSFFQNPVLVTTVQSGAKKSGRVHIMGLVSDGGVHSHIDHLFACLDLCAREQVKQVWVHAFTDGRDTPPDSGRGYIQKLLGHPTFLPAGKNGCQAQLASLSGRYYAMDRDQRWERTDKAIGTLTGKEGHWKAIDGTSGGSPVHPALQVLESSYANGITDEFIMPTLLDSAGAIQSGDSLIFFNYRSDRARQISKRFLESTDPRLSAFCGMTQYDSKLGLPMAFTPQSLVNIFPSWLEQHRLGQLRIAETEKYAHVTFFFNGGREKPFDGEQRILIESPRDVATYDLKPEMSAFEVAQAAEDRFNELLKPRSTGTNTPFHFALMNFANADMVGHTGNYSATVRAMEALDTALARVCGAAEKAGFQTLITADHGNAEEMCDDEGRPHTQHTLNPVPLVWIAPGSSNAPKVHRVPLKDGTLVDIMPTLCDLMNLPIPNEVTGKSLLDKSKILDASK